MEKLWTLYLALCVLVLTHCECMKRCILRRVIPSMMRLASSADTSNGTRPATTEPTV
jgi:hypothetical protein